MNKLDLVDYCARCSAIGTRYRAFAAELGLGGVASVPISALRGDNVTELSAHTSWYSGPTLLDHENVEVDDDVAAKPFRMIVQWVNRPDSEFRGFSGWWLAAPFDRATESACMPSGSRTTVARIVTYDGDLDAAVAGESITVTLCDEVDISRADVIAVASDPPGIAGQFESHIVWMSDDEMLPGRRYLVKLGATTVGATIDHPKHGVNVNTLEHVAAKTLTLNEIGVCNVYLDRPVPYDRYVDNRDMGGFIVVDRMTNTTVGAVAAFRPPSSGQRPLAGDRNQPECSRRAQGHRPAVVVHRYFGRRQVDDRQHTRAQAPLPVATLSARW